MLEFSPTFPLLKTLWRWWCCGGGGSGGGGGGAEAVKRRRSSACAGRPPGLRTTICVVFFSANVHV